MRLISLQRDGKPIKINPDAVTHLHQGRDLSVVVVYFAGGNAVLVDDELEAVTAALQAP